ncbi:MAG: hypothetical protein KJO69_10410 [Gammaproteobacteria bacterium]|nr:hypothetical protein [Gammaproteobacteria bacterium]NNJ72036.1 hypothetical protein [Enterobacterales bacterium]
MFLIRLLLLSSLLCLGQIKAETVQQLYQAYQAHLANDENLMALDKIEQAFQLSLDKNGVNNATTQALKLNYAQLYVAQRDMNPDYDGAKIMVLLNNYIDFQRDKHGDLAIELIDPLMALGTARLWYQSPLREGQREFRDRARRFGGDRQTRTRAIRDGRFKAITQFNKAIQIAEQYSQDYPLLPADLQFEAAKELFARGIEAEVGRELLTKAHTTYASALDETDARVILSAFWLARALAFGELFSESTRFYDQVISGFQAAGVATHDKAIESYKAIIENYETQGLSELATPYIQDLGRLLPWFKVREQVPLYQPAIELTKSSAEQSAEGRFLLTINTDGKVSKVTVLDFLGDQSLRPIMEQALLKRRYTPKYQDGLLVSSQTQATVSIQ